jgi:hypothetical protein
MACLIPPTIHQDKEWSIPPLFLQEMYVHFSFLILNNIRSEKRKQIRAGVANYRLRRTEIQCK